jgi:hypothetical protein
MYSPHWLARIDTYVEGDLSMEKKARKAAQSKLYQRASQTVVDTAKMIFE